MPYLDATLSDIERQGYIKYLSNVLRVPEEQVLSDYQRQRRLEPVDNEVEQEPAVSIKYNPLTTSTELNAMLVLLGHRDRFERFRSEVKLSHLTDLTARKLYTVLEDAGRQDVKTDDMILQMIEEGELRDLAVTAFTSEMFKRMDVDETLNDAIFQIKLAQLEEQRDAVQRMLNGGEMDMADQGEFVELLQRKVSLDKEIEELKKSEMDGKE